MVAKKKKAIRPKQGLKILEEKAKKAEFLKAQAIAPTPKGDVKKQENSNLPKVAKSFPRRTRLLLFFGTLMAVGAAFAIIYFFSMNMILAIAGVPFLFIGGLGFFYFWGQSKDIQVKYVGEVPAGQVNALVIYANEIKFENIAKPEGFPWLWIDDGKHYYVYWDDPRLKKLTPFTLPDQQYYDPRIFGKRVLTLPCHRKIFQRKQDLIQKLRPFIAGVIGVALWILILTTTGGNTGG